MRCYFSPATRLHVEQDVYLHFEQPSFGFLGLLGGVSRLVFLFIGVTSCVDLATWVAAAAGLFRAAAGFFKAFFFAAGASTFPLGPAAMLSNWATRPAGSATGAASQGPAIGVASASGAAAAAGCPEGASGGGRRSSACCPHGAEAGSSSGMHCWRCCFCRAFKSSEITSVAECCA